MLSKGYMPFIICKNLIKTQLSFELFVYILNQGTLDIKYYILGDE